MLHCKGCCGLVFPTYHKMVEDPTTALYRKGLTLRKTKTDRVDARMIASMLLSDVGLKPYTDTAYHNEKLKSLTRYRFDTFEVKRTLYTAETSDLIHGFIGDGGGNSEIAGH